MWLRYKNILWHGLKILAKNAQISESDFAKPLNRKTFPYFIATSYFQVLFANKFDSNSNSL